jgi:hypothetical protein
MQARLVFKAFYFRLLLDKQPYLSNFSEGYLNF